MTSCRLTAAPAAAEFASCVRARRSGSPPTRQRPPPLPKLPLHRGEAEEPLLPPNWVAVPARGPATQPAIASLRVNVDAGKDPSGDGLGGAVRRRQAREDSDAEFAVALSPTAPAHASQRLRISGLGSPEPSALEALSGERGGPQLSPEPCALLLVPGCVEGEETPPVSSTPSPPGSSQVA